MCKFGCFVFCISLLPKLRHHQQNHMVTHIPSIGSLDVTMFYTDILSASLQAVWVECMLPFHCTSGCVDLTSYASHPYGCESQRSKTFNLSKSVGGVIKLPLGLRTDLSDITWGIKEKSSFNCPPFPVVIVNKFPACSSNEHIQLLISYRKFLWVKTKPDMWPHKGSDGVLANACPRGWNLFFPSV